MQTFNLSDLWSPKWKKIETIHVVYKNQTSCDYFINSFFVCYEGKI